MELRVDRARGEASARIGASVRLEGEWGGCRR